MWMANPTNIEASYWTTALLINQFELYNFKESVHSSAADEIENCATFKRLAIVLLPTFFSSAQNCDWLAVKMLKWQKNMKLLLIGVFLG